jgi:hypothetical protein
MVFAQKVAIQKAFLFIFIIFSLNACHDKLFECHFYCNFASPKGLGFYVMFDLHCKFLSPKILTFVLCGIFSQVILCSTIIAIGVVCLIGGTYSSVAGIIDSLNNG